MKKQFLETGEIVTTHGIKGEVKVYPWCDSPEFLLDFDRLYLDSAGKKQLTVTSARLQKNMVLLTFEGVDSIEDAKPLRGKTLYLNRDDVQMEEGEYFVQDLMGLEVVNADDLRPYGTLTQVSQTGANDVYHILFPNQKEYLIPAIPQVVIRTDLEEGKMYIRPLKGLFDDEN